MSEAAPRVGCGAAIVENGRILLVKRRLPPESGSWSLPGGKVEFLERAEDAVLREVREEVGLTINVLGLLQVSELVGVDGQHWVSPVYRAHVLSGEVANLEPDKLKGVGWFSLAEPPLPLALAARQAIARIAGAKAASRAFGDGSA